MTPPLALRHLVVARPRGTGNCRKRHATPPPVAGDRAHAQLCSLSLTRPSGPATPPLGASRKRRNAGARRGGSAGGAGADICPPCSLLCASTAVHTTSNRSRRAGALPRYQGSWYYRWPTTGVVEHHEGDALPVALHLQGRLNPRRHVRDAAGHARRQIGPELSIIIQSDEEVRRVLQREGRQCDTPPYP